MSIDPQHQWINKLFDFDFVIEYRPGRLNSVMDAISRHDTDTTTDSVELHALSGPLFRLLDKIPAATMDNEEVDCLHQ